MNIIEIAQLATAIILFFTLLESIRQRRANYKPSLMFEETPFYLRWYNVPDTDESIAIDWRVDNKTTYGNFNYKVILNCKNVGLGASKYIIFKFNYNEDILIEEINKLITDDRISCKKHEEKLTIKYPRLEFKFDMVSDLKKRTEIIKPIDHHDSIYKLTLPTSYTSLYAQLINLRIKSGISNNEIIHVPLNLTAIFKDLGNSRIVERHQFAPIIDRTYGPGFKVAARGIFRINSVENFFG